MKSEVNDLKYESINLEEICDTALNKWKSLPDSIKNDPCFMDFQRKFNENAANSEQNKQQSFKIIQYSKTIGLSLIWILITCYLLIKEEKVLKHELHTIGADSTYKLILPYESDKHTVRFWIEGYFGVGLDENTTNVCKDCLEFNFFGDYLEFVFSYDLDIENPTYSIILAAFVLIFLYGLIIWEVVHRTFASVLSSALAIACLAIVNDRPTMKEIINWIDFETIMLLFCMMIITGILTETGVFNYLAVFVYRHTKGNIWALIHSLCILTTVISAFLDNVTTTLLISPVTITLCETMELDPVPVLMMIVIHANIGGTTTPVGDPPNVIITSNPHVVQGGVSFMTFTKFMGMGVFLCVISTAFYIRVMYRNVEKLKKNCMVSQNDKLVHEWEEALKTLGSSDNEAVLKGIIQEKISQLTSSTMEPETFELKLKKMEQMYPIKDKPLLYKACAVLIFVISLFLIESVPEIQRLSLSWCALLGLLLLLIISNKDDMDIILSKVEWPTLLFFASMFIIMEIVDRLGLIKLIGDITKDLILSVPTAYQLSLAIIIILWVSGIVSAFIDSIPVTAMMVKVVVSIAQNKTLGLPLPPLIWALAFGPCLGGNGTLVGASANVICAGLAQQRGYQIRFIEFLKLGFPVMLVTLSVTTMYLVLLYL
uniref:CSON004766 protein n=1 Tax=Culicoides sonorensis TaxID=179676 RepID=A0A336MVJ8_CULSO